jgi:hypothetical protein
VMSAEHLPWERRTVSVVTSQRRLYVELDGQRVGARPATLDEAIEVAGLVARSELGGDQEAGAELDRRGIEPPVLKPDHEPVPDTVAVGV